MGDGHFACLHFSLGKFCLIALGLQIGYLLPCLHFRLGLNIHLNKKLKKLKINKKSLH